MDIKDNLVVIGTQTISNMTTAGFVKNSATGLLSSNIFSKARAHCNTNQSLTGATTTLITLDDTDYDTDGIVNLSSDYILPTKAGCYLVTAQLCINVTANRAWALAAIYKNTTTPVAHGTQVTNFATYTVGLTSVVTDWIEMNGTTDILQLRAFVSVGTTLNNGWHPSVNYISIVGPF